MDDLQIQHDANQLEPHEAKKLSRGIEDSRYEARYYSIFCSRFKNFNSQLTVAEKDAMFAAACTAALFKDTGGQERKRVPYWEFYKQASRKCSGKSLDQRIRRMQRSYTWNEFMHHFGKVTRYLEKYSDVKPDADALYKDLLSIRRYGTASKAFTRWLEKIYE